MFTKYLKLTELFIKGENKKQQQQLTQSGTRATCMIHNGSLLCEKEAQCICDKHLFISDCAVQTGL